MVVSVNYHFRAEAQIVSQLLGQALSDWELVWLSTTVCDDWWREATNPLFLIRLLRSQSALSVYVEVFSMLE